ncbi:MAG: cbb3-type cytochrome c oxidase subunit I [Candidatus Hodgkinia cicadicola]
MRKKYIEPLIRFWEFIKWDHSCQGKIYILIAGIVSLFGIVLSVLIRAELRSSGIGVFPFLLGHDTSSQDKAKHMYNVTITVHGLVMLFYVLMPTLISGLGSLTLPRLLKTKGLAFPQIGYAAILSFISSLVIATLSIVTWGTHSERGIATGWTLYPPLSNKIYHNGLAVDFAILAVCVACISSLLVASNFVSTILWARGGGLKLTRMPLLAWALLISSLLLLLIMPVLIVALTLLLADRYLETTFYDPKGGGDPTLFQHLFWFFGHPEVYVLILPVFGIISEVIARFSNRSIFGKMGMILSMIAIATLGVTVWGHHMYTVGLKFSTIKYFVIATVSVAIPTALKILSWLSTIWSGSIRLSPPVIWAIAFIILFIIGGVTGLQLANASLSNMLHDTHYVVAHFHYVLAVAAGFGIFTAWYYWFPKLIRVSYNEVHSKTHALITFIIVNLTFFPQHLLGLLGLPRRCVDYPISFEKWNRTSSSAAVMIVITIIIFLYINLQALSDKNRCPKDPWKRRD